MSSVLEAMGVAASTVTVGGGGVWIGRTAIGPTRRRRREHEAAEKAAAEAKAEDERAAAAAKVAADRAAAEDMARRDNVLLELVWSINGRPETEWSPALPGLRHLVDELDRRLTQHVADDQRVLSQLTQITSTLSSTVAQLSTKVEALA